MALRIRIEHGQDAGKTLRLGASGVYRFGRSPGGSAQILDMKVSKEHFEILAGDGEGAPAAIRDLGSSHGTLLNGQKVEATPRPLNAGDEIRIGLTVIRVMSDGPADAEAKPVGPLKSAPPAQAQVGTPAARTLPPDPLVGHTLAGYKILEKVGAGGMGAVYRAEQLSLHREVALKVLSEKLVSDSAFVDQFVNEARAAGQLNHPNVVQVYDVGEAESRHFFSMEFIHGGPLESKIPKGEGVPWQEVLPWFLDAANALIFAEKKGILHRDIKPDNFMLSQDGSVKLCDLGLAKKSESADLLAAGIIGTPHFIAPEAIRRKTEVDRRADLYSLGCTFFRLLTGKNPYPAPSVKEILLAHLNVPVPRASAFAPDVPRELDEVVFKLMQKDPAARFQGADELWQALDKIRLEHGLAAHGLHPGRAKKLAILGGLVAVAAVGTLVYLEPWNPKTETRIVKEPGGPTIIQGEDPAKARAYQADAAFNEIKNDALTKIPGGIDQGDNWRRPEWEGFLARYDDLAKDQKFAGTEGARRAGEEAQRVREVRAKRRAAAEALAQATAQAGADLDQAVAKGLEKAKAATDTPLDAEKAIDETLAAAKDVAARRGEDGTPLVTSDRLREKTQPLEDLRGQLVSRVREAWGTSKDAATKKAQGGTAEALDAGVAELTAYADKHAEAAGTGEVARTWNDSRRAALALKDQLLAAKDAARRRDLLADRASYFAFLKEAFSPRAEDGTGAGFWVAFHLADGLQKATQRGQEAKTREYRALFEARQRDFGLASRLPGLLTSGFGQKGFKEKLGGPGWMGSVKGFTPEGVQVTDRLHLYAEEGLGWFYDLFYEKGSGGATTERYALDADMHEALGVVAEAAGVIEASARVEAAVREWQKAAEMDASRAARLQARIESARAEQSLKALLESSQAALDAANDAMKKMEDDLASADARRQDAGRKAAIEHEAELRKSLVEARQRLDEAEAKYPRTVGRALLADAPDGDAAYAGETLPAAAPPPSKPGTPPAMGDTAPGMGKPGAMDGGDGSNQGPK